MFERFTDSARATVVSATAEGRALHHHYVGTEHLLLGLLDQPDATAARVLDTAGISRDRVLAEVERMHQPERDMAAEDKAALRAIGIDLDAVRAAVEDAFGPGALAYYGTATRGPRQRGRRRQNCDQAPRGHIPFAPRSKKVLELSLREALRLKHDYIGTEHILLALVREGEGMAARILVDAGVGLDQLRRRILAELKPAT